MSDLLKETFEIHDSLNPVIWDTENDNKLRPEISDKIINIVDEFKNFLEDVPLYIVDVYIVGSNASYNYNDHSDLDVHIVVNYEMMDGSEEIIQSLYNAMKNNFNKSYDIEFKGINVELYVEDIKSLTVSNGVYSVCNDKWIRFPEKISAPDIDLEPELSRIKTHVYEAINSYNCSEVEKWINSLYLIRRNSLATEGEYGRGNLIFKQIRSDGLLDKLKDRRLELKSKELSIENAIREYYSSHSCNNILTESTIKLLKSDDSPFDTIETNREDYDDYIVITELVRMKDDEPRSEIEMKSVYSKIDGSYVGSEDSISTFYDKGILPQSHNPETCGVADIGFNEEEQKWYGWSHRAMYGFGIGDTVDSEDHLCSGYLPVGFECQDLDDCKMCAIAFAKEVS